MLSRGSSHRSFRSWSDHHPRSAACCQSAVRLLDTPARIAHHEKETHPRQDAPAMRLLLSLVALALAVPAASAADPLSLTVYPEAIRLVGPRAEQRVGVLGVF